MSSPAAAAPQLLRLLAQWLPAQRWYAAGPRPPALVPAAKPDPLAAGPARVWVLVLRDTAAQPPVTYQVPVVDRPAARAGADGALVGVFEDPDLGRRWLYDGPHDPAYVAELVGCVVATGESAPTVRCTFSRVLVGEQSNTSVICEVTGPGGAPLDPVIVKVFRTLAPGDNPDVEVCRTLGAAGSRLVPRWRGDAELAWVGPDGAPVRGYAHVATSFLAGSEDAWRTALRAAGQGRSFATEARELGAMSAALHAQLAASFGTRAAGAPDRARVLDALRQRYAAAVERVPELSADAADIRAILDGVGELTWPPLQRVHGDYHLGQVLRTSHGWVALDFEGEPLRPAAERTHPDLPERDVAGMLRSFDYAAGSIEHDRPELSRRDWAQDARSAFLAGYRGAASTPTRHANRDHDAWVRAFEVDKALYEIAYEATHRPTWLPIPRGALDRLLLATRSTVGLDAPHTARSPIP